MNRSGKFRWNRLGLMAFWIFVASNLHGQAVQGLDAIRVASGLSSPLFVTAPPGDFDRVFIVQQGGQIRILNLKTGVMNSTPFLTVSNLQTGGEQGLLGLAFDPDYATNGKFYVKCTAPGGAFNAGVNQIRQYQVSANPDIADNTPANIKIMLSIDQPETNHNGGWIGFSPRTNDDHNLYIATGDGGASNDADGGVGHIEPGGNAQNKTTLLGKMLRIHVDPATGTYTTPPDNPYANPSPSPSPTPRPEIWLLGLRNPFRDSFDRATGRMMIGDVGQDTREEIDVQQPANPGGGENYGWRDREGFIQNPAYATATPTPTPNPPRVDPIFDYPHSTGRTVIGGYVYRGAQFPALEGIYVFGDYLGPSGGSAKVFTLNYDGVTASNFQDITTPQLFPIPTTSGNVSLTNLSSIGEDAAGELYFTDIGNGNVYKLSPMLVGAASRKIHGTIAFDLNLPLTGTPGTECRSGGPNGNYTMVFKFAVPVASVGSATVAGRTGSVSSQSVDSTDARQYLVNLTGVTDVQNFTVTLNNVTDVAGNISASVSATMAVLVGDTNVDRFVDAIDVSQVKSQAGNAVTSSNFREDVSADGFIDAIDVALVKSKSGNSLPGTAPAKTNARDKAGLRTTQ
jgi:glucose/arabinose dehydrogenase